MTIGGGGYIQLQFTPSFTPSSGSIAVALHHKNKEGRGWKGDSSKNGDQ